jgi:hypothetical protein
MNYLNRIKKAWPKPGHTYEQRAISPAQSKTQWFALQSDSQLMPEQQILCPKPASRAEQVSGEPSERMQNRKHRSQ